MGASLQPQLLPPLHHLTDLHPEAETLLDLAADFPDLATDSLGLATPDSPDPVADFPAEQLELQDLLNLREPPGQSTTTSSRWLTMMSRHTSPRTRPEMETRSPEPTPTLIPTEIRSPSTTRPDPWATPRPSTNKWEPSRSDPGLQELRLSLSPDPLPTPSLDHHHSAPDPHLDHLVPHLVPSLDHPSDLSLDPPLVPRLDFPPLPRPLLDWTNLP